MIETLSFGSDIQIRCNNSYFILNEINNEKLNWKFANQTLFCRQDSVQQAATDQCGVTRLNSQYLKVTLKSLEHNEHACAYCRINAKSMSPIIKADVVEGGRHMAYRFEIKTTGLMPNESFEILWAKRVSARLRFSYNYWFLQGCVDPLVKILETSRDRIIFVVDDVTINRVEFLIRRCQNNCRTYDICEEKQFLKEIAENYFPVPETIEKVSCNSECLYGTTTTTMLTTSAVLSLVDFSSKNQNSSISTYETTSNPQGFYHRLTLIVTSILVGCLLTLLLILLIVYSWAKIGDKHSYGKANHVDPDEDHH